MRRDKMVENSPAKFSNILPYRPISLDSLLYAKTAGIAATSPKAVANKASAMPGATTAKDVFELAPML